MIDPQNWIIVGKLVAPQGLKGEIRINPNSDFPERFTEMGKRWLQREMEAPRPIQLISGRKLPGKSLYIVRFEEINDRSAAEALIGNNLLVASTDRPQLSKGEFHLLDLIGLKVKTERTEDPIGLVRDLKHGGNDLLEIELFLDQRKVLIPFVKEIVPVVNIESGWLIITPPPGLLQL